MKKNIWIKGNPKPQNLSSSQKMIMIKEVESFIENSQKLSKTINRFELRAGRVYFYQLEEQSGWNDPNTHFTIPLIDGRYAEFKYARITIYINQCTLDWQRYNDQWMTVFTGTLIECLQQMDETNEWFQ